MARKSTKPYKCCFNCQCASKCAVPNIRTEENAEYYDRCVKLNEKHRFCGANTRSIYAKNMYQQRYCKYFESRLNCISKTEALRKAAE